MKIDTQAFKEALTKFSHNVEEVATNNLENALVFGLDEARDRTPIDIGELKENSGYYIKREENILRGFIGFMEFYAVYVHQGTGIFALNGDGRKTPWWWKGTTEKWEGWHFTHGQRPKRFLYDAVIMNLPIIEEKLGG